jgi:4-amino-4-deoxy-L-arabinose transferase-like glycosyltransferase
MLSRRAGHLIAALLILAGVLIRLALVLLGWPRLNSDEATMGLMARHIALHGEHPAFFYGQSYMGTLEAFLAAGVFKVFGASALALRLPSVLLYGVFLCVMYALARALYSPLVAVATLAVLAVGPEEVLFRQIEVVGGYQESLVFGTALALVCALLVSGAERLRFETRAALLAVWGVCAGLGLWSDPLILPFVLTTFVVLVRRAREAGIRSLWPVAVAGFLVGLAPLLLHDISNQAHSAVGDMLRAYTTGGGNANSSPSLPHRILGLMAVSLPLATGARPVCALPPSTAWPLSSHLSRHAFLCTGIHITWSGVLICLTLAALLGTVRWRKRRPTLEGKLWAVRTALLDATVLTVLLYVFSSAPGVDPRFTARYLSLLLIAAPALLHPLLGPHRRSLMVAGAVLVVSYILVLVYGTVNTFDAVSGVRAQTRDQEALVSALLQRRVTRLYSDYRTCDRLAFQSGERILCGVLNADLRPGQNRVPGYLRSVQAHKLRLYLFPRGSVQIARLKVGSYRRTLLRDYVLLQR